MRAKFRDAVLTTNGRPVSGASVTVREPGTATPITETMYTSAGSVLANPLTTSGTGEFEFYLDIAKRVDLYIAKAGLTAETQQVDVLKAEESSPYSKALDNDTNYVHTANNLPNEVMSGVFTPLTDSVRVSLQLSGIIYGIFQEYFSFLWTQDGTPGDPFDVSDDTAWLANEHIECGSLFAPGGTSSREFKLDGLEAGTPVTWAVYLNDASYADTFPVQDGPFWMAIYDHRDPGGVNIKERWLAVLSTTTLNVYRMPLNWSDPRNRATLLASITLGATGLKPFFTADGAYLYVPAGANVYQYDTSDWTLANTIALPVGTTAQGGVSLSDSSKVWISDNSANSRIIPITVATAVVETPVTVGGRPLSIWRRPGTEQLYVGNVLTDTFQVIDGTDGSIDHTVDINVTGPFEMGFSPDGTKVYVIAGTTIVEVNAAASPPAPTGRTVTTGANPKGVVVTPDGLGLVAANQSHYYFWDTTNLDLYDTGPLGATSNSVRDIEISANGALYFTFSADDVVFAYPGGTLYIGPDIQGTGAHAALRSCWATLDVYGAIAGPND